MDTNCESKLIRINPQLARKVRELASLMDLAGQPIRIAAALRSWGDQEETWRKGRDVNGVVVEPRKVVTYAKPGYSWHQFGLAVDLVPLSVVDFAGWSPENPIWETLGAKGESLGLTWGGRWKKPDRPHFQLSGSFPVSPNDEVRHVFLMAGMMAVWVEAGLYRAGEENSAER